MAKNKLECGAESCLEQLAYRGGPLLSSIKVFTIFWGRA